MPAFWEGVVAGYGIAIPVGAIAILIVDTSLRRGFGLGFMAGAGAAGADLFYAVVAALAGEVLSQALAPYAAALRAASAAVLLLLGGYGLWRALRPRPPRVAPKVTAGGRWRTFSQFLGLTLLNPLTVAYFGALILGRDSGAALGPAEQVLFVLGAGLASLSWQSLLAAVGAVARQRLAPRWQKGLSVAGNLVVVALGLRIALQIVGGS